MGAQALKAVGVFLFNDMIIELRGLSDISSIKSLQTETDMRDVVLTLDQCSEGVTIGIFNQTDIQYQSCYMTYESLKKLQKVLALLQETGNE